MAAVRIAVLSGDGIGQEVTAEAVKVLQAVGEKFGHDFSFQEALVGGVAIEQEGQAISDATMELCDRSDAILFGAVGAPHYDDPSLSIRPEQALFRLRKTFGLYANLRPVKLIPALINSSTIKAEVLNGVDLVVVRELTGGLYFGQPSKQWQGENGKWEAVDTMCYTEDEIRRILHTAFELARGRRKILSSVDKANVLSTSRLWRRLASEVAREYPDVQMSHLLVDSCAMHLIRNPRSFDVIVTENLFGDILTDEASMLAGSMGMLPSASLGTRKTERGRFGLYEPIHGSAPDIMGQNKANPLASILSAAMLLRYSCGLTSEAELIERAVISVIEQGYRTGDIQESGTQVLGTTEMGQKVIAGIGKVG